MNVYIVSSRITHESESTELCHGVFSSPEKARETSKQIFEKFVKSNLQTPQLKEQDNYYFAHEHFSSVWVGFGEFEIDKIEENK